MTTKSQPHNSGRDEVYQLIEAIQQEPTDEALQEKLVLTYKDLVESIARKYSRNSAIHEDLVQVGMIGLLAAVRRYDPSFGKSFESFAIPTIIGEIKRFIRDKTWSVHVPRRIKELGPKIKKAVDTLTTNNQKSPTVREIADYLEVSEEDILETMEMGKSYKALSVDRKIEADSDGSTVAILDLVGNEEAGYNTIDQRMLLEKILPILSEREQQILKYTYFENMSQKETGELLGISQMHVSRLQRRSLRKLREAIQSESTEVLE
ncbi:MAG: RNA polymerase sigma factor SigB [Bacillota bacterium]|uniref:RNA polymerase sigma factor n=1 Tax=Virgibacillus salarius TaxID=447199 RepID=A0A941DZL3_9BACI|nr:MULTISPECIES: RNA polymerase sigma factor SigB [Virgibacillus]NAZ08961.1 RNA polymerase sigma factor SigB [Agaribacter marinus]MBR7796253.1 RNA polymerase sigma factor SigB [Virgibacillus salarius]MCC2251650.1 RNA polymerase sigma factor SigB [Virgibacillus sp. AGTR]MDY7045162.1 RNA polymerase sigma factor SigB [Virgibacillus sp. M23]QRZ19683.1 RNA polymerase sigma factor SigB [Virgibacillus sp. AGTR]